MPFEVKNEIAIITGSAQGFGKEFAKRLLQKGAKVCISDVNEEQGLKTIEELGKAYGKDGVTFKRCDVSKEEDWQDLWAHTETAFGGKVSLLVNNAGVNPQHGWKASINIMLTGVGYGTFLALEKMGTSKGGHGGRIVNIASMAGLATGLGSINDVGYTAAKHGVVALTRSFESSKPSVESGEGIKSYAICPYFADTALVKESVTIEDLTRKIKGRVLTVNEVGHAFDLSLKIDQNGACYVVFPDCPPFPMPNPNMPTLGAMIAFGKTFGGPLSLETFNGKHVILAAVLILLFLYMVLCIIF